MKPRGESTSKRLLPALLRIIELHGGGIECFRVELSSGPPERRLVLLVARIGDDQKKLGVAVDTTAILRRTPPFPGDTPRVLAVVVA